MARSFLTSRLSPSMISRLSRRCCVSTRPCALAKPCLIATLRAMRVPPRACVSRWRRAAALGPVGPRVHRDRVRVAVVRIARARRVLLALAGLLAVERHHLVALDGAAEAARVVAVAVGLQDGGVGPGAPLALPAGDVVFGRAQRRVLPRGDGLGGSGGRHRLVQAPRGTIGWRAGFLSQGDRNERRLHALGRHRGALIGCGDADRRKEGGWEFNRLPIVVSKAVTNGRARGAALAPQDVLKHARGRVRFADWGRGGG